jgi:hypothetical protein
MATLPKCCDCGQFMSRPAAWKMVYSGAVPEPDHEIFRCQRCFDKHGPFVPDPRIKPECSCGVFATINGGGTV